MLPIIPIPPLRAANAEVLRTRAAADGGAVPNHQAECQFTHSEYIFRGGIKRGFSSQGILDHCRRRQEILDEAMNEAETRAEHIDPALKAAGWGVLGEPGN